MSYISTLSIESQKTSAFLRSSCLVALSSFVIGLLVRVVIPLPFTPVPLVIQNSVVLLFAVLLGPKRAAAAVAGFLIQGVCGLPVFAVGMSGLAGLCGPTGGYLLGYFAASIAVGYLTRNEDHRTPMKLFLSMALGNAIVYFLGVPYLATFVGLKKAILLGLAPFLVGDFLKLIAAVKILQWLRVAKEI